MERTSAHKLTLEAIFLPAADALHLICELSQGSGLRGLANLLFEMGLALQVYQYSATHMSQVRT